MEKVMDDLKLAEANQGKFLSLIDEVQSISSSIISMTLQRKDLDLQYGSIRESLLQQARELASQGTEMEEARRRIEMRENEAEVKMGTALGFLGEVVKKERELGLLKDQIRERGWELQGKEKELGLRQRALNEIGWEIRDRERERDSVLKSVEEESQKLQAEREELAEVRNLIVLCNSEYELKEKQLRTVERDMGFAINRLIQCEEELKGKQNLLGEVGRKLDGLREEVCGKERDLCSLQKSFNQQSKELELSRNVIRRVGKLFLSSSSELQEKEQQLLNVRNLIVESNAEHESKEKQLTMVIRELQGKEGDVRLAEQKLAEYVLEVEGKQNVLGSLERKLDELREEVCRKEEQLCSLLKSLEEQSKELELRKKETDEAMNLLQVKERELASVRNFIAECSAERQFKENQLGVVVGKLQVVEHCGEKLQDERKPMAFEEQSQELEMRHNEIETLAISPPSTISELQGEEKQLIKARNLIGQYTVECELREEQLCMVDRVIQDKERDMGSVQQRLEECREELVGKERLLGCLQNYMTEKSNELELLQNKMKRKTNLLSNSSSELQQKERELAEARNSITVCNAECELEEKQLGVVVGKLQVKEKVTCSTQHNLEECAQELETKQKPLGSIQSTVDWLREKVRMKREELDSLQKSLDEQRNKKQAGTTDGALPCERNPDSPLDGPSPSYLTDSEVSTAIRQSSDPARMIIDQMKESIFQTNTKNYNQTVVRNHIVMLEQLMGVSPKVSPEVEEAATSLAIAWMGNLRQAAHGTVDVLAFLLFLAAFGVGSRFEGEDTLKFVEMVAHHERAPELCRSLGLSKWIPGLVQRLSEKDMHMEAIRFILVFKLAENFPPNQFLLSHLEKTRIFEDGNDLLESQFQALNKHLDSLKAISQQVSGLGLDPSFLNHKISDHLQELETRVGRKRSCLIATGLIIQTPRYAGATVSGNKWPLLQLGNSTEEGQRKKRQKKS